MVKNKLHKFGCSFSTHKFFDLEPGDYPHDPSNYASIVANHLDLDVEGYAREGQGNSFISVSYTHLPLQTKRIV